MSKTNQSDDKLDQDLEQSFPASDPRPVSPGADHVPHATPFYGKMDRTAFYVGAAFIAGCLVGGALRSLAPSSSRRNLALDYRNAGDVLRNLIKHLS